METGIINQNALGQPIVIAVMCLLGAASLAVAINAVWKIADRLNGKKLSNPLEVRAASVFVRQEECVNRHMATAAEVLRIEKEVHELRNERRADIVSADKARGELYDKVDKVRLELTDKIDDMPDRIIATLSKLGLLRKPSDHS